MIPKIINYCWFGKKPKSKLIEKCINSWKKYCPDYKIIEWNESNFDININNYVKEAYENENWAFVSDYARLWVVYNFGGIYLDTDVELIKQMDFLTLDEAFFCFQDDKYIATGLGFGAEKNNKVVKRMLDDYNDIHFVKKDGSLDITSCPIRNTKTIQNIFGKLKNEDEIIKLDNIVFYPKEYFCPLDYETKIMNITENTIAIHWFDASWLSKKVKIKKRIHAFIKRIIGVKQFEKIKRKLKK